MDYSSMTMSQLSHEYEKWYYRADEEARRGNFIAQDMCYKTSMFIHRVMREDGARYEP